LACNETSLRVLTRKLDASLRGIEPQPVLTRLTNTKKFETGDVEMVAFEVIGLTMLALFFGAMVNGNSHAHR
jgi:hypothetical protein